MANDIDPKGVNRRALLLSAWSAPVVASFALSGMQTAPGMHWGNNTLGPAVIARGANGIRPRLPSAPASPDAPTTPGASRQ